MNCLKRILNIIININYLLYCCNYILSHKYIRNTLPNILTNKMEVPLMNPTVNQTQPNGLSTVAISKVLRSTSQFIVCPFCNQFVPTKTERSCSCPNICCFLFTGVYPCFQILREKDLNCYNASHFCPNCNKLVHQYRAC